MPNTKQVKTALQGYIDGWKNSDREAWLALFAEDAVLIDPVGSEPNTGLEAIAAFWDRIHDLPMKYEPEVHRIVACGDEGLLVFKMISRPEGSNGGMTMEIADTFKINDEGKITQLKAYWDNGCMGMLN